MKFIRCRVRHEQKQQPKIQLSFLDIAVFKPSKSNNIVLQLKSEHIKEFYCTEAVFKFYRSMHACIINLLSFAHPRRGLSVAVRIE